MKAIHSKTLTLRVLRPDSINGTYKYDNFGLFYLFQSMSTHSTIRNAANPNLDTVVCSPDFQP